MKLRFCGVRGSTPAVGAEFDRVGGHTSCIAVTPDGADVPSLCLDAGTGLRRVTDLVDGAAYRGTILVTHLHWDHVQGLPFFAAGDRDGSSVRVLAPADGVPTRSMFERIMSPPLFPIGPDGLRGDWHFDDLDEGDHRIEGIDVLAVEVPHKGGRTFGYRLSDHRGSVAYVPDHLPADGGWGREAALRLIDGVDVLIHDAQFTADEAAVAESFGHATIGQAVEIARAADVGQLLLFHHSPVREDEHFDAVLAEAHGAHCAVAIACEREEFTPMRHRPAGGAAAG